MISSKTTQKFHLLPAFTYLVAYASQKLFSGSQFIKEHASHSYSRPFSFAWRRFGLSLLHLYLLYLYLHLHSTSNQSQPEIELQPRKQAELLNVLGLITREREGTVLMGFGEEFIKGSYDRNSVEGNKRLWRNNGHV